MLLVKDLRESLAAIVPSFLLSFTLFIILQFSRELPKAELTDFWFSFFVASSALFYRSFSLEHRSRNFGLYRAAGLKLQLLFWTQVFVQSGRLAVIGFMLYLSLYLFGIDAYRPFLLSLATTLAVAPFAVFLGLSLKGEREFLFSFVYFPFVTPLILAGVSLTHHPEANLWWSILISFGLGSAFIAALVFEYFYDDFT